MHVQVCVCFGAEVYSSYSNFIEFLNPPSRELVCLCVSDMCWWSRGVLSNSPSSTEFPEFPFHASACFVHVHWATLRWIHPNNPGFVDFSWLHPVEIHRNRRVGCPRTFPAQNSSTRARRAEHPHLWEKHRYRRLTSGHESHPAQEWPNFNFWHPMLQHAWAEPGISTEHCS